MSLINFKPRRWQFCVLHYVPRLSNIPTRVTLPFSFQFASNYDVSVIGYRFVCSAGNMEMIFRYVRNLRDISGEKRSCLIEFIEGDQNDVSKWRGIICDSDQLRSSVRKEISVPVHTNRLTLWFREYWSLRLRDDIAIFPLPSADRASCRISNSDTRTRMHTHTHRFLFYIYRDRWENKFTMIILWDIFF